MCGKKQHLRRNIQNKFITKVRTMSYVDIQFICEPGPCASGHLPERAMTGSTVTVNCDQLTDFLRYAFQEDSAGMFLISVASENIRHNFIKINAEKLEKKTHKFVSKLE